MPKIFLIILQDKLALLPAHWFAQTRRGSWHCWLPPGQDLPAPHQLIMCAAFGLSLYNIDFLIGVSSVLGCSSRHFRIFHLMLIAPSFGSLYILDDFIHTCIHFYQKCIKIAAVFYACFNLFYVCPILTFQLLVYKTKKI